MLEKAIKIKTKANCQSFYLYTKVIFIISRIIPSLKTINYRCLKTSKRLKKKSHSFKTN